MAFRGRLVCVAVGAQRQRLRRYFAEWLPQQELIFSRPWRLKSNIRCQLSQFLPKALYGPVDGCLLAVSSHSRQTDRRTARAFVYSDSSSSEATTPIVRAPPSRPHPTLLPPEATSPNTIALGVRAPKHASRGAHRSAREVLGKCLWMVKRESRQWQRAFRP